MGIAFAEQALEAIEIAKNDALYATALAAMEELAETVGVTRAIGAFFGSDHRLGYQAAILSDSGLLLDLVIREDSTPFSELVAPVAGWSDLRHHTTAKNKMHVHGGRWMLSTDVEEGRPDVLRDLFAVLLRERYKQP